MRDIWLKIIDSYMSEVMIIAVDLSLKFYMSYLVSFIHVKLKRKCELIVCRVGPFTMTFRVIIVKL